MREGQELCFETVWAQREDQVYRERFGEHGNAIYRLTPESFESLGADPDVRWLFCGVLRFPPTRKRRTWLYVSSGLSTPWDRKPREWNEHEPSGLGIELVLETREESLWAIDRLQRLSACALLMAAGKLGPGTLLGIGRTLEIQPSVDGDPRSLLRYLFVVPPSHYDDSFSLPWGHAKFLHGIGITAAERDFAIREGAPKLLAKLEKGKIYPVTNPSRRSCC